MTRARPLRPCDSKSAARKTIFVSAAAIRVRKLTGPHKRAHVKASTALAATQGALPSRMHRAHRVSRALALTVVLVCAVSCDLPDASPTPVDANRPRVTMTVIPGTVEIVPSGPGTIGYQYQACPQIRNPSGVSVHLSLMEFTPIGADGTLYDPQGTVGGFSIPAGRDSSQCWGFSAFRVTHPTPARYRLRFTYYMLDNPTLLSVEGTSTLTLIPSRFL